MTMAREMIRQGGRSARIQAEVHRAVNLLLSKMDRSALTVPMIAEEAGVPPSTIYRRWGDLSDVLADVAIAHMRPIAEPDDTGALGSDLETFILQYAEEMSSKVGRQMLLDVLSGATDTAPYKCCQFTYCHLETLNARAVARGETPLDIPVVIDRVVAPIVYHILFADREIAPDYVRSLLATL
jgi:AcrR family transcriptional regulator